MGLWNDMKVITPPVESVHIDQGYDCGWLIVLLVFLTLLILKVVYTSSYAVISNISCLLRWLTLTGWSCRMWVSRTLSKKSLVIPLANPAKVVGTKRSFARRQSPPLHPTTHPIIVTAASLSIKSKVLLMLGRCDKLLSEARNANI